MLSDKDPTSHFDEFATNQPPAIVRQADDLATLRAEIRDAERKFHRRKLTHYGDQGRRLLQIKETVGEGNFKAWFEANLADVMSLSPAMRWMRVAGQWETVKDCRSLNDALRMIASATTGGDNCPETIDDTAGSNSDLDDEPDASPPEAEQEESGLARVSVREPPPSKPERVRASVQTPPIGGTVAGKANHTVVAYLRPAIWHPPCEHPAAPADHRQGGEASDEQALAQPGVSPPGEGHALVPKEAPPPTAEEVRRDIEGEVARLTSEIRGTVKRWGIEWPKARRADLLALLHKCLAALEAPAPVDQADDQSGRESSSR
jgi:hypothetical protein